MSFARLTYVASLRDLSSGTLRARRSCRPFTSRRRSSKRWRNATKRYSRGFWNHRWKNRSRTCEPIWSPWRRDWTSAVRHWRKLEAYRVLCCRHESPDYLKDLFCSNIRALLEILDPGMLHGSFSRVTTPITRPTTSASSGSAPRFGHAARQRVRLHHQPRPVLVEPSASVTISDFNEIHRPVVFAGPVSFLDVAAPRDPPARCFQVAESASFVDRSSRCSRNDGRCRSLIQNYLRSDPTAPPCATRTRSACGSNAGSNRSGIRSVTGGALRWVCGAVEHRPVAEEFVHRNFVPAKNLHRIQVIDHRQGIESCAGWERHPGFRCPPGG